MVAAGAVGGQILAVLADLGRAAEPADHHDRGLVKQAKGVRSSSRAETPWSSGGGSRVLSRPQLSAWVSQLFIEPMLAWMIGTPACTSRRAGKSNWPKTCLPQRSRVFAVESESLFDIAGGQHGEHLQELHS